ncbi:MAG: hypothetical protein OXS33_06160 [bacterium]|nr:hypothetical protein [bacterium]
MGFTEDDIRRLSKLGSDPQNWESADPDARDRGHRIAQAIADSYTDEDWKFLLNTLSPSQAAHQISHRPPEDRERLLRFIESERRAEVQSLLIVAA